MTAAELFKAGKLSDAIEAQVQEVKLNPADQARRLFLFELLAFSGNWDRAGKQADALQYEEIELESAAESYRKLVAGERKRQQWWLNGVAPQFLIEPPQSARSRLDAANLIRQKRPNEAGALLNQLNESESPVAGTLNGKPFTGLRDADDLWGTVLEVMAHGDYYWVPLAQIETIDSNPPRFPRDLLWRPARLSMKDGPAGDVFLPVLYPGSHEHPDDLVKLGRLTDWRGDDTGPILGFGQHTYLSGDDQTSLCEWQQLTVH
jgi:type VI secretion system protein ImpE